MSVASSLDAISGLLLWRPQVHGDERGFFLEVFREERLGARFVQANHSHSRAGTLRGLHYHRRQADAWYLVSGSAQVALADLRTGGPVAVVTLDLSADEPAVLYIPPGIAHGFLALTDLDLVYWVTDHYDASDEFGVVWNDPTLAVPWKAERPVVSERDASAPALDWSEVSSILSSESPESPGGTNPRA